MSERCRWPALAVHFHLTRDCNLRCSYCYSGPKRHEVMSFEVGRQAVDFFLERTEAFEIRFFGGEPLLEYKTLQKIVQYAEKAADHRKIPLRFVLVTNGTLFTREVGEFCRQHQVGFTISLDGNQVAHDTGRVFHNGRGSFSAVERNFGHILEINPYVLVLWLVHPGNVAYIAESFRFLLDRGFVNVCFSHDHTAPALLQTLPELERQYEAVADLYVERVKSGKKLFVNLLDDGGSPFQRNRCGVGRSELSVAPGGEIYPCTAFADHDAFLLGNVQEGIDGEREAAFLEELECLDIHLEQAHSACPEVSFCRIGCACTNLIISGSIHTTPPGMCELGSVVERVRSRMVSLQQS